MSLLLASGLIGAPAAHAASVETLLMPGPLSAKHAKYESDCSRCHDRADRSRQSALCTNCHQEIDADVREHRGYHGRMSNAGAGECRGCHAEHVGRDADIVRLNTAAFDHERTEFPLSGAHRTLACAGCHRAAEAWRRAPTTCIGCHKADDYHDGQLGTTCEQCHSANSWAGGKFDHDKTRFALTGAHQSASCGACHLGGRYKGAPQTCVGCHATDDAHRGERGDECGKCHTTTQWKTAKFNHDKETGFALLGRHDQISCVECHRTGRFKDKLPQDCAGCHRADDAHAARFGSRCGDCHGNDVWRPVDYDHAARTKFALVGAHAKLDCHICHTADVAQQKLGTDCIACHRAQSPHGARFAVACDSCHGQVNWMRDINFDHDLTQFPLLGLHSVVSCAQCHQTEAFAQTPAHCIDCHAHNDVHKGGLGTQCDSCHSPNGWAIWEFDHAKQTGFALTGAHAKINCADCHRRPAAEVKLTPDCIGCHRQDDVHDGQFGRECQRCHSTVTFRGGRAR